MANEAVLVQQLEDRLLQSTCSGGAVIAKGAICRLLDPNTVAPTISTDTGVKFGGIAVSEKASGDGTTTLGMWRHGVFDLTVAAGETVTAGDMVTISGANTIRRVDTALISGGILIGRALQDGAASEVIEILVGAN